MAWRAVIVSCFLFFSSSLFADPITNTEFLRAVLTGQEKQVKSFKGQEINDFLKLKDKEGHSPLHLACIDCKGRDKTAIINHLIRNGADINQPRFDGKTPLHMAVLTKNIPAIKALIAAPGLDPNAEDRKTYTALLYAVDNDLELICELLLDIPNIDPNRSTSDGATPLHFAAMHRSVYLAKLLVRHPLIDINAAQELSQYAGATPLHFAALQASPEIVDLLLDQEEINVHAEVDSGMFKGFTPLHFAVMNPEKLKVQHIVKSLMKAGANPKKGATCALKSPEELTQIRSIKKLLKKKW